MGIVDYLLNENGVRFSLSNQYYKDGSVHESPSDNHIQIGNMVRLFQTLEKLRVTVPQPIQGAPFRSSHSGSKIP